MPTFSPPSVNDLPSILPDTSGVQYQSWRYYGGNPRARTVLRIGGVYQTVESPSQLLVDAATEVYMGGHIYTVSAATAADLVAAGYVVT